MSIYEYDEEKHMRQEREYHFSKGLKEGRIEGRKEGQNEGRKELLIQLISKKLGKGKSIEEIASELEESVENIRPLIEEIHNSSSSSQFINSSAR